MSLRDTFCRYFGCPGRVKFSTFYLRQELEEQAKRNRAVGSVQRRVAAGVEQDIRHGILREPLRLAGQIIDLMSGENSDEKGGPPQ